MDDVISKVPFARIEVDPEDNARTDYGNMTLLTDDIRENGLLQPLIVRHVRLAGNRPYKLPDTGEVVYHRYFLIAGFRRYEAIRTIRLTRHHFLDEVPVVQKHCAPEEVPFIQLRENILRKELNHVEEADAIIGLQVRLKEKGQPSGLKEIAARIGRTQQWVTLLVQVVKACCDEVRKALAKGDIPFTVATDLSKLPMEDQPAALAKHLGTKKEKGTRAAKRETAEAAGKTVKPTTKELTAFSDALGVLSSDPYWKGVGDGVRHSMGKSPGVRNKAREAIKALGMNFGQGKATDKATGKATGKEGGTK